MIEYFTTHTAWYWERYFHHCTLTKTYKEAWQETEKEHYDRFEFHKYDDYTQFRTGKSNWIAKTQGKEKKRDPDQMELF